jgi:hypothetical protein
MYRSKFLLPACANHAPLCPEAEAVFLAMNLSSAVNLQALEVWWTPCLSESHGQLAIHSQNAHLQGTTGSGVWSIILSSRLQLVLFKLGCLLDSPGDHTKMQILILSWGPEFLYFQQALRC